LNFLPSTKFVGIAIVGLALFGVSIFVFSTGDTSEAAPGTLSANTSSARENQTETDTDGDGLKDWEEALWGTDPHNIDSDGDGARDGEEVGLRRDPTKPGPDDQIRTAQLSSGNTQSNTTAEPQTLTERLAQEFFSSYLSLGGAQKSLSNTEATHLVDEFLTDAQQAQPLTYYSKDDISVSSATSIDALRTYANAMGRIIRMHAVETENEAVITNNAVQQDNPEMLAQLDPIIESYEGMLADSLELPVPHNAQQIHLNILNAYARILQNIVGMQAAFTDPVKALQSVSTYQANANELLRAFQDAKNFYQNRGITFSDAEGGLLFTSIAP